MKRAEWLRALWIGLLIMAGASARGEDLDFRQPALSPDGAWLAFVWGGDLWTVPSNGGEARLLYGTAADERRPVWSPDGERIVFAAKEDDGYDLFLLPARGGAVRRLTWAPGDDLPSGFTPDGRKVLFQSRRGDGTSRIYEVPVRGGEPRPLTSGESFDGVVSPDGGHLAFTTGVLPWWRTASRGTGARRLLVRRLDGGDPERPVPGDAQQLWPQWMPGGRKILFVSSASLVGNLWMVDLEHGELSRLTDHTEESVRCPALAADGSRVAYELAGEIYLRKLRGEDRTPRRVEIRLPVGADGPLPDTLSLKAGIERAVADPTGRFLALECRGEIFLADLSRVPDDSALSCIAPLRSPWRESSVAFARDGRSLLFASDASGRSTIRRWDLSDPAEAKIAEVRAPVGEARLPADSPDGALLSYVRRGGGDHLVLADAEGGRERDLLAAERIPGFAFRPNGRSIACVCEDASGGRELLLPSIYGGAPGWIGDAPSPEQAPLWSEDGRVLVWLAESSAGRELLGIRFASTTSDAVDSTVAMSWPRPPGRITAAAFASDGTGDLLVLSETDGGSGLWRISERGDRLERRATSSSKLIEVCPLKDGKTVICVTAAGALFKLDLNSGEGRPLPIEGASFYDRRELFRQIYLEATAALGAGFYDPGMHLKDWPRIRDRYLRRLPACRTTEEVRELLLMAAGELDASHVNLELAPPTPGAADGDLGLDLEVAEDGGLRVRRAVPGGPGSLGQPALCSGDRILSLNGVRLGGASPVESLLTGQAGAEVELEVADAAGSRRVRLKAIDVPSRRRLEENAIDRERARRVAEEGEGRVAYLHLRVCDGEAVARLAALLAPAGAAAPKGLVLDLRENFGGYGMESFLCALDRRPWAELRPRGTAGWLFPAGAWRGSIAVVIDETTASAAELIALGVRELGLGTLLGEPTCGAVIAEREFTLLDGSRFQLPAVGWYRLDGMNLENRGVTPDVPIEGRFGTGVAEDRGLGAAIRAALRARPAR